MGNIFELNNVLNYIWLIPIIFSIHEIEEWNILKWYQKYYRNLPESTNTSIRIHIVVLSLVSFLLTYVAYVLNETFLYSLIVAFLASFIFLNLVQHIIWTVQLRAYSLGLITGILSFLVTIFVNIELVQNTHFNPLFYGIIVFTVLPIRETMRVKGEMTPEVRKVHHFFIKIEKILRKLIKDNKQRNESEEI